MTTKITNIRNSIKHAQPRILAGTIICLFFLGNIKDLAFVISQTDIGYGTLGIIASLTISSILFMSLTWIVYDVAVNVASSLGYKDRNIKEFSIVGNTGTINLSDPNSQTQISTHVAHRLISEKYEQDKPLSALGQSRARIYSHIEKLQNSSIVNLFIGIAIAAVGITILGSIFFEVEKYVDKNQNFNATNFLTFALLPRISIAFIVQIFSFFFIIMYRSNVNDVRYFQNEISNIDAIAAAVSFLKSDSDASKKYIISALMKTERNRFIPKGQILASSPNDDEIIERLIRVEGEIAASSSSTKISPKADV